MELHGTGRHLNTIELRLWTALVDASRILDTELERQLTSNHDMTHREYEILVRIDGDGGRMRMSTLAKKIEASGPLVSQTIARLEHRGWLERIPAADDARGVDAVLLPAGVNALTQAAKPHAELIRALLHNQIPASALAATADAMHGVADHLRQHRAQVPCEIEDCPMN